MPLLPKGLAGLPVGDELPCRSSRQFADDPAELRVIMRPLKLLRQPNCLRLRSDDPARQICIQVAQGQVDQSRYAVRNLAKRRKV